MVSPVNTVSAQYREKIPVSASLIGSSSENLAAVHCSGGWTASSATTEVGAITTPR
jgi:hypothetical protein